MAAFREKVHAAHPDTGGSPDSFSDLVIARNVLLSSAATGQCPECRGTGRRKGRNFGMQKKCRRCDGTGSLD